MASPALRRCQEDLGRMATDLMTLVYRLLNPLGFVAFKMGCLRGVKEEHI
jgi:hypothetical protein